VLSKRTGREKEFSLMDRLPKNEQDQPVCPSCGKTSIVRPEGEVMYFCANAACPAQAQQRIEHFASRGAMDIRGIGENLSATLFKEGLIKDIAEIYTLKDKREELVNLEKLGEKSADNILEAIENSKQRPLARLIYALGIKHVGYETAELLAGHFRSMGNFLEAGVEDLTSIESIGPITAESIIDFLKQEENRDILRRLENAGVFPEELAAASPGELPLAGKEFVVTGRLESFSRQEAETKIKERGGSAKSSVSRKTDYVVAGSDPGSKLTRARELGITVLDENQFLDILENK
jgi:DNA ligase (NAD+)